MAANVRRDRLAVPELDALLRDTADARMAGLAVALGGGPLIALALDFWTWRRLTSEGLSDTEAAELMARVASGAARIEVDGGPPVRDGGAGRAP
jgi:hypothetical protein